MTTNKENVVVGDLFAVSPFTGLIATTQRERSDPGTTTRPNFSIYNPNGTILSSIRWSSGNGFDIFLDI